jgi:hypothetical protein
VTRRELDAKLRDIENALLHLSVQLPALTRDVAALRERLNVTTTEEPAAPPPAPEPEQQELGTG